METFECSDSIFEIAVNRKTRNLLIPKHWLEMFLGVRNTVRNAILEVEPNLKFDVTPWTREEGGGGVMSIARGKIIEKAAVQMSVVSGAKYPSLEKKYEGKPFQAAGVSVICHTYNPNAPIAHMNIRLLSVGDLDNPKDEQHVWIGGGADLTPMVVFDEDTKSFHGALKQVCENHELGDYEKFTKWCDEYFFIPHLKETRGVGGIFYDYLSVQNINSNVQNSFQSPLSFQKNVGEAFASVYQKILEKRCHLSFSEELKEQQLVWRSRYAEFNLAYDRGTRFGLMSGGNPKAILASLPPVVKWP